ncbi:lipoyl domain-containing protein [Pannonibacter phragmitetus]|uniref:lipoyl domain-containing protein n=1 Tax=Pannonibacter phragmitetus TaxID=121719 RepID=UPI003D2EB4F6
MPNEVIMPKVDMDMASGKLATWHVAPGEWVEKGAPLFDIETDKAAMEVEASASGFLHHVIAEGTDVPIGATVAWLYGKDEAVGEPPNQSAAPAVETPAASPEPAAVAPAAAPVAAPAGETAGGGRACAPRRLPEALPVKAALILALSPAPALRGACRGGCAQGA